MGVSLHSSSPSYAVVARAQGRAASLPLELARPTSELFRLALAARPSAE